MSDEKTLTTSALREMGDDLALTFKDLPPEKAERLGLVADALLRVNQYLVLVVTLDGGLIPYAMPDSVDAMRDALITAEEEEGTA